MFWKNENFRIASQDSNEWIDGFVFIANRRILDLLNTRLLLEQGPLELLSDIQALGRWLAASEYLDPAKAKELTRRWDSAPGAVTFLKDLLGFREQLRDAIIRIETGAAPTRNFIDKMNERLMRYPARTRLCEQERSIVPKLLFEPQRPTDLWSAILSDMAELLNEPDSHRIRQCESCFLHFFDTSKKGSRRWCSMRICGNKLKVAAYQRKRRASP